MELWGGVPRSRFLEGREMGGGRAKQHVRKQRGPAEVSALANRLPEKGVVSWGW